MSETFDRTDLLAHLRRVKALLRSPLYTKDDIKQMSALQIFNAHKDLFQTHNSRRAYVISN